MESAVLNFLFRGSFFILDNFSLVQAFIMKMNIIFNCKEN